MLTSCSLINNKIIVISELLSIPSPVTTSPAQVAGQSLPGQESLKNEAATKDSGYLFIQRNLAVAAADDPLEGGADAMAAKG